MKARIHSVVRSIFVIAIIACISTAEAQAGFINTNTGAYRESLPRRIGGIHNPTPDQAAMSGWVNAVTVTNTFVVTNAVPSEYRAVADAYKGVMESIFGGGAHTNPALTEEYVAQVIGPATNIDVMVKLLLMSSKDKLREYWPQPLWHFPYGVTNIVQTNIVFMRVAEE